MIYVTGLTAGTMYLIGFSRRKHWKTNTQTKINNNNDKTSEMVPQANRLVIGFERPVNHTGTPQDHQTNDETNN